MTVDMSYFVRRRISDPSFTVYDAMTEYFKSHPSVATEIIRDDPSFDDILPDDYLEDYLSTMSSYDAFMLGRNANYDPYCDYFTFDGYGNIKSISVDEVDEMAINNVTSSWFADRIIDGEIGIPSELEDILELWGPDGMELCEDYLNGGAVGSHNARAGRRFRR